MTDKQKFFYVPQNFPETKSMRTFGSTTFSSSTKPTTLTHPHQSHTLNTEPSTHYKAQTPVGSSFTANPYLKNISNAHNQHDNKLDSHNSHPKKEEMTTVFSNIKGNNDAFELRGSVPIAPIKKPDVDFLRMTSFTPKPKPLYFGNDEGNSHNQSHRNDSHDHKSGLDHHYSFKFDKTHKEEKAERDYKNEILAKFGKEPTPLPTSPPETKVPYTAPESKPLPYSPPSSTAPHTKPQLHHSIQTKHLKSNNNNKNVVNGFSIGKELGVGKFAQVFLAKHCESGFVCVLKRLSKEKIKEYQMEAQVIQQIKIHAFITHPNIVQFYGIFNDEKHVYMVLQYLESGTLFDHLGDKLYLEEPDAAVFLRQICMAVKYLHNKGIAHRDIKPENIIISYGIAKLCDFGWSARVLGTRKTYCGTFDYAPPEILERKQYDQTVDLWCIGVLAYELLTNRVPFEHKERKITMQKILNVDRDKISFPENISDKAKDFVESLIRKNPEERLKAYKLLDHPFLKQYEEES